MLALKAAAQGEPPPPAPAPAPTTAPAPEAAPAPTAPAPTAPAADLPPPPPPRQADAAPPAATEPPPPAIVVATPPPPPPVTRTYHYHEGFYLRLSAGLSLGRTDLATNRTSSPDYELGGGGLALDVLIGGSPAPGFALGGGIIISGMTASEIEIEGSSDEISTNASQVLIGPFIDGFPDPNGGFHVGGMLALAGVVIDRKDETEDERYEGNGFGMSAWVGYDWWVGPEWSVGGLLRFTGSITRQEKDDLTRQASTYGLGILFTALYH